MAPFFPAACQYLAAIGSSHTLSETVNALTPALMRLIRTFFTWHSLLFFLVNNLIPLQLGTIPAVWKGQQK